MRINGRKTGSTLVLVLLLGIAGGNAHGELIYKGADETIPLIITMQRTVEGAIVAFGEAMTVALQLHFERTISAIAVATKQEALAAHIVSDGLRQSAQQLANTLRAQQEAEMTANAISNYSAEMGQGSNPCNTQSKNQSLDKAFSSLHEQAVATLGSNDVSPGRLVGSVADAMQQRVKEHRDNFCTPSEAEAKLCKESELPGGDSNAALFFEPAQVGSLMKKARLAYMQHVLGLPDQAVPPASGAAPVGESYLFVKNRKDAFLSIPAYSLAYIDAANTAHEEYEGKSANEILRLRANAYFGGPEANIWARTLTVQTQRGLLVEAVKMTGLESWMRNEQYKQNQRLEANLAALLLLTVDAGPALATEHKKTVTDTLRQQIK